MDAIWDRAFLYKQLDEITKATEGFKAILKHYPHHFKVINELAQIYRSQGRTKEAIQLYEDAIIWHTNNDEDDDDDDDDEDENEEQDDFKNKLGYSEINMLSELYLILNDYKRSLNTIKTGLRLVQKRQNETWWVDRDDDDEYLEDDESRTEFPIELRVRMGVCRVYLNQVRLGTVSKASNKLHFHIQKRYTPCRNISNIYYNILLPHTLICIKTLHILITIKDILTSHYKYSRELSMCQMYRNNSQTVN